VEAIRANLEAYSDTPHFEELHVLHRAVHTLRGASASFGLSRLSAAAAAGEKLAKEAMQTEPLPGKRFVTQMQWHLEQIQREASNLEPAESTDLQALDLVAASEDAVSREQRVVYLCEDDSFQRMALSAQIGAFGFQIMAFAGVEQLYQAVKNSPPDAIVMDMVFSGGPICGADMVKKLQAERETPIPTIFISSQDDFTSRLSAVRAGSSAYFVKPVNSTDLSATLTALTTVDKPEPYRVMIVDDDTHLSELYATILQGVGMVTMEINDPLLAMSSLPSFKPDLILTDMNMPGCNGMELAKTIRQSGDCLSIPIVFLSTETDTDLHRNAMRMGGDEFLTKPIKPEHLISAVAVRAERMKIIRSLMIRDSMTGLFNHTAIKERLDTAIAEAAVAGGDLCFAMIDMDRFKEVNDSYGHPRGDRVLIALAKFLRHRLRKADLIGRYGGEEFAVICPASDLATATSLLDQLRESFAAIKFPAGGDSFSVTFSCGAAALSRHKDAEHLCKAAEAALYEAKKLGRNRLEKG
jgi:diguanylate cyclase (GGDEF)-like protein